MNVLEVREYFVPSECATLLRDAGLLVATLRSLGLDDLADAEIPRLRELARRAGPSDRIVIVTDQGLCYTRITQPWG